MTLTLKTEINIQGTPEKVWNILTDFSAYTAWNPFIKSVKGQVALGERIEAFIQPPNSKGMTFKPVVLVRNENHELKWLGHLLIKGLFDGEHQFLITDNGDGTVRFQQNEKFTGLLVRMFAKSLKTDTKAGFEAMNLALKQLVEEK